MSDIVYYRNFCFRAGYIVLSSVFSHFSLNHFLSQEYLNEILIHWEITEKEADVIADAIRSGLEDAAVRGKYYAQVLRLPYEYVCILYLSYLRLRLRTFIVFDSCKILKHIPAFQ